MTGLRRVVLASGILLFVLQLVSIFIDWVAIQFDEERFVASLWSDGEATIKYVVIVLAVLGIIVATVGTLLDENIQWFAGGVLLISIVNGALGLFYYLQQQNDIEEIQSAGIDVAFFTEIGFYLFLAITVLLVIASILAIVLPEEE